MLRVVEDHPESEAHTYLQDLDTIAREGARRMLMAALQVEASAYVERHQDDIDAAGHRLVVRNGKGKARKVTCGAGTLEVEAPRVNDKRVTTQQKDLILRAADQAGITASSWMLERLLRIARHELGE